MRAHALSTHPTDGQGYVVQMVRDGVGQGQGVRARRVLLRTHTGNKTLVTGAQLWHEGLLTPLVSLHTVKDDWSSVYHTWIRHLCIIPAAHQKQAFPSVTRVSHARHGSTLCVLVLAHVDTHSEARTSVCPCLKPKSSGGRWGTMSL